MGPERKNKILQVLAHRQPDMAVVLENVHDPHNVFAIMRTCDAVGIQDLYLLNTIVSTHKNLAKLGKKSSAGAQRWLTLHDYDDIDSCMHAVKQRYHHIYATHLSGSAHSLYDLNMVQPVAIVFGNEHAGVSQACLAHCSGNFIIPQYGMVQSLNVSVACAVTLYEALRQRTVNGSYSGEPRLAAQDHAALAKQWKLYDTGE